MKKILFSISILGILIITSCGSDDGGVSVNNQITIGDETFDINSGGFVDLGESEGTSQGAFALSDGNVTISGSGFTVSQASVAISFTLVSVGTSGLNSGSYEEGDVVSIPTGNVYFSPSITAGTTNYTVTGGTITLSGSSPNYTVSFDLTLNGGDRLTGGYSGEFATN